MKKLLLILSAASILALAVVMTSCSSGSSSASSSSDQLATLVAKADKAAADAATLITTAQAGGYLKTSDAEKLTAEIEKARKLVALTGKIDFTDARTFLSALAASGALPPQYALGIQGALILADTVGL